jgi:HSA domain
LLQKAADAKTGGRVRSTRHAISSQKGILGTAFSAPKPVTQLVTPTKPKRSLTNADVTTADSKRLKRHQPLPNGHKHPNSADVSRYEHINPAPKIRLKFRVPKALITHPHHIAPPKQYGSLSDYLNSYIQLDDYEDTTPEKAEQRAQHEASLRNRILAAKRKGWLQEHVSSVIPKPQSEPTIPHTRHDFMLKHVINFSGLMAHERKSNVSRAKKISQMILQHFKKLEGTDEKEIKAEEKRIRRLAKQTAQEVRKKWKLADKVSSRGG